jgi:hypothetical protein
MFIVHIEEFSLKQRAWEISRKAVSRAAMYAHYRVSETRSRFLRISGPRTDFIKCPFKRPPTFGIERSLQDLSWVFEMYELHSPQINRPLLNLVAVLMQGVEAGKRSALAVTRGR